jgi:anti-sigma factor RsiW
MHLTDDQLNEYLDNEIIDRAPIELHLSSCDECAARLAALRNLFAEIESLPDLAVSRDLTPHLMPRVPSLPRWLTLTATLQAALSVIAFMVTAPLMMQLLAPYVSNIQIPSFADMFVQFQSQWMAWLDLYSQLQMPSVPEIPVVELSSMVIVLTLVFVSMLWIVGNGLLLRNSK